MDNLAGGADCPARFYLGEIVRISLLNRLSLGRALIAGALLMPCAVVCAESLPAKDSAQPLVSPHSDIFAVINGRSISTQEYESAFAGLIRQRFYHGQVPEGELAAVREEIKERLVQRVVLLDEAKRRGIVPDQQKIESELAVFDQRYANRPDWRDNRERLLGEMRIQLEEQNLVAQLDQQVRNLPDPSEAEVRKFYTDKPELFTEPEKIRLSVILLKVDPSSPATAWEGTRQEANAIYQRIKSGADFGEAARLHSAVNAEASGDMGYLHRGMLPDAVQAKVDKFEIGAVSEPVELLEGLALFRLDERVPAKQRDFSDVANRAKELLVRENQEKAWKSLVKGLSASADVKYLHSPGTGISASGAKN